MQRYGKYYMAASQYQFKVNQLAKDLDMKGKDLISVLTDKGFEVKAQSSLEALEFGVLLDTLTKQNQIENIDDYIDGVTYIESKKKKPEVKEEPKAEIKEEPKVETKAEPKVETKAEPKVEAKTETKVEEKPAPKTEVKAEAKPAPKAETKVEAKPMQRPEGRPAQAPQPPRQGEGRPVQTGANRFEKKPFEGNRQGGFDRPQQNQGNSRFDRKPFDNNGRPAQGGKPGFDKKPQNRPNNRFGNQGEDYVPSAPKPKFQPQPIVRGQTPKGSSGASQRGGTRVVDTRSSSVDLSKYDERLDSFVSEAQNVRADRQKLKKQDNRNPYKKGKDDFIKQKQQAPVKKKPLEITVPDEISVGEFASRLKVTAGEVIKKLMMNGIMATVNQTIDYDTAYLIADELGAIVTKEVVVTIEERLFDDTEDTEADLITRAPVVCVMGHVDHGKTSILDAIRHTNVTTGEAGGITQHIGAYRVMVNDQPITFLDTPGHEAFTAMRARGAMATDIAILVVAADDGIMPQTIEAINHAKAAGIDIIVAINKMDKPTANPDAIMQEMTKYDLVPEEWGGDVICVPVSAHTGMGINDLLENVLLVAEVKELKANPNRRAKGIVIEAKLDKGRGPVATVLVQNGTLHTGDIVIAGTAVGRVRLMTDHNGKQLKEAGPSVPVELIGLAEVPSAGDEFQAVEDERMARDLAEQRRDKAKEDMFKANARANLNDLFDQLSKGVKNLNIIVKADVGGSVEAVKASLEKISNEEVKVQVIHAAAGGITESDVTLAAASNAIIVGFNVRPDRNALDSAERQEVEIRTYRVIYECIEEITAAMKGMLAPEFKEVLLGHAEVRQTIHVPNVGTIAGSYILDGKVTRASQIRIVRDGIVIFEDKISSLKRFKDDAKEVAAGYECGIGLEKFNDIKLGDILESYVMEQIER